MASALENLARLNKGLKPESPDEKETNGLLRTGLARLADAITATQAVAKAL
jgi:hypothetical protein